MTAAPVPSTPAAPAITSTPATSPLPWSILDLAEVGVGETVGDALRGCVELARRAEAWGYQRIWYAEHHNMPRIASAATSVLIAHVAAHTSTIRLGAGGVMLPNHSPLVIAEQFGTLAELHPGRIELGLGRAPGTDQRTWQALRRDPRAADRFPSDVLELQGYLDDRSRVPGIQAVPGRGTKVPLFVLGSSLFGAQLAAQLGLPYAFASHFAPQALEQAIPLYRERFEPSDVLREPHVIAGVNVIAAERADDAAEQLQVARRRRAKLIVGRQKRKLTDDEVDLLLEEPMVAAQVDTMLRCTAAGEPDQVVAELERFRAHAQADELILAAPARTQADRLRTFELVADATRAAPPAVATSPSSPG
jgi:luciferase family oxidoreductase group 1